MRIGVVMFYDDVIKEYGDVTRQINELYCQKHGLDLICSHDKRYSDRHAAWERLPLIIEHLSLYDYLIWIDADAFFYYHNYSITDIIKKNPNADFIFSRDNLRHNLNTGIFIVKNTDYSHLFLNKWAYDEELYKTNPYPEWWDQGVLMTMINYNTLQIYDHCVLTEYGVLQHFYKHELQSLKIRPFVLHLASWPKQDRVLTSKMYLNAIKTNLVMSLPTAI
jgi:hypothetical protein